MKLALLRHKPILDSVWTRFNVNNRMARRADIEIDGSFVGNTPSSTELAPGEHTISVKKAGFKAWERKVKVGGGDIKINAEMEKN